MRKNTSWSLCACSILCVWSLQVHGENPARQQIDLNGQWDYLVQQSPQLTPPDATTTGWTKTTVPGMNGADHAWYRKNILIPKTLKDQQVEIYFHSVGVHSKLFVNGKAAGEHFLIMVPWAVDITKFIEFGKENEILVGVESGNVSASKSGKAPWNLSQVWWTYGNQSGFFYDVLLKTHPAVYTSEVYVQPSFRQKKIKITFIITNQSPKAVQVKVNNSVLDPTGKPELVFEDTTIIVEPGKPKTVTIEKEWKTPRCWFPHDPYLYHLQTKIVSDSKTLDDLRTRFGFREVWVEKAHLMFNGVHAPVRRTTEGLCFIRHDRENIHNYIYERRLWGVNNIRWHALPASEYLLDLADEMGMLITQEGDMWMDQGNYLLTDEFWKQFGKSWEAFAKFSRNHPCILSYSIANESYNQDKGVWQNRQSELYKRFHAVNEIVKRTDPGTIIEYASGDEVCGDSPVRNWHYPSNLSTRWAVPNDFFWLAANPHVGSTEKPGHRTKPVIVGEDLYDGFRGPTGAYAAYGSEEYYLAGPRYKESKIFREVNKYKIDAYRMSGIAVINPADPCIKPWASNIIPPVTLLAKDFHQGFYAGTKASISYGLANEVWFAQKLTVQWQLVSAADKKMVLEGAAEYDMPAGTIKPVTIDFTVPNVKQRTDYILKTTVLAGNKPADQTERLVNVFPKLKLKTPAGLRIGIYDPKKDFAQKVLALGLEFKPIPEINQSTLKNFDILILGPEAAGKADLTEFLNRSGNVLALEQSPKGFSLNEPDMTLDVTPITMTFPSRPDHPILNGIKRDDLRWWANDHWVARSAYILTRPRTGNFRILVKAGDPMGFRLTPLLEIFRQKGRLVISQMLIGEKIETEPAARILFQNTLDYLATPLPESRLTGLIAQKGSPMEESFANAKLRYEKIQSAQTNFSKYHLIIAEAEEFTKNPAWTAPVKSFVEAGGKLLLHSLTPQNAGVLAALGAPKTTVKPLDPVQCARCSEDPLVSGIGQFDLWWRVGDWVESSDGSRPVNPICNYVLNDLPKAKVLIVALPKWEEFTPDLEKTLKQSSIALAELTVGKGRIIVDQLQWDQPRAGQIGFPYAVSLLWNLGAAFETTSQKTEKKAAGNFYPLSLKGLANQTLKEESPGVEGLNNLARVPSGPQVPFEGIPFDISGTINLKSPTHAPNLPERVPGLRVGRKVKKFYFLHGSGWGAGKGEKVMYYQVNYKDKTSVKVEVLDEIHMMNWWFAPVPMTGAKLAWQGKNEVHMPICLYLMEWINPRPQVEVETMDFLSANSGSTPFVVGVTAETLK